jgi:hypothetical protein
MSREGGLRSMGVEEEEEALSGKRDELRTVEKEESRAGLAPWEVCSVWKRTTTS